MSPSFLSDRTKARHGGYLLHGEHTRRRASQAESEGAGIRRCDLDLDALAELQRRRLVKAILTGRTRASIGRPGSAGAGAAADDGIGDLLDRAVPRLGRTPRR